MAILTAAPTIAHAPTSERPSEALVAVVAAFEALNVGVLTPDEELFVKMLPVLMPFNLQFHETTMGAQNDYAAVIAEACQYDQGVIEQVNRVLYYNPYDQDNPIVVAPPQS